MLCTQARNRSLVVSRGVIIPKSKERRCYEAREDTIGTTKDAVKHIAEKKKSRRAEPYARGDEIAGIHARGKGVQDNSFTICAYRN